MMVEPDAFFWTHSKIGFSHLFFLRLKSSNVKFTANIAGFAVRSRYSFR